MDRTNGRTFRQINHDTTHYLHHDRSYSGLETKKRDFKTYPYPNYTYVKFREHRSSISGNFRNSISGNYKSRKARSPEKRSANLTSKQKSDSQFAASFVSFESRLVNESSSCHVVAENGPTNYRSAEHRLNGHVTSKHISVNIHSSANHKTTVQNSPKFPSEDDIAKCRLMKVYPVIEPILRKLLHCIFKGKQESETLELYLMKRGMDSKWQKHFSEEQIKNIQLSPDFSGFDSTLVFRCVEVFRDFNPILNKHENLKIHIDNSMKELKSLRNLLSHNRKKSAAKDCLEKAKSLKKPLENLLEIIHIWDRKMNITSEKMKICEEIRAVMNGNLSEDEFRYVCLLNVINCIGESVLSKVTLLISYDKQKKENFKEYFQRNGMNARTYKDTFFKEEKDFLESNSEEAHPDLTLYCKIIEACRKWHPSLKVNEKVTKDLAYIIKQIREIRNHIMHNMISMSSNECNKKAQELGYNLKNLLDLVNFLQNVKSDMAIDAAKSKIDKINSDINSVMSIPYTLL